VPPAAAAYRGGDALATAVLAIAAVDVHAAMHAPSAGGVGSASLTVGGGSVYSGAAGGRASRAICRE